MEKYRDWNILESLPDGWVIDKTAGSPAPNTVFITNGKSVLNGQKRALLKVYNIRVIIILACVAGFLITCEVTM